MNLYLKVHDIQWQWAHFFVEHNVHVAECPILGEFASMSNYMYKNMYMYMGAIIRMKWQCRKILVHKRGKASKRRETNDDDEYEWCELWSIEIQIQIEISLVGRSGLLLRKRSVRVGVSVSELRRCFCSLLQDEKLVQRRAQGRPQHADLVLRQTVHLEQAKIKPFAILQHHSRPYHH